MLSSTYLTQEKEVIKMGSLFLFLYEILAELIPFTATFLIIAKHQCKKKEPFKKKDIFIRLLFALYIITVLSVTSAGTVYELFRDENSFGLRQLNLIPFSNGIDVLTILNIVMLVPFGFMLSIVWKRNGSLRKVMLNGFVFSLLIELSQLLNIRCTDIDDLIANTLGSVIGYLIYRGFAWILKLKPKNEEYIMYEPMLYIFVMLTGRCLFFNEYGAAKLIFGF